MRITKNHKLYWRDKDNSIRRLDKISKNLYNFILDQFINGTANKEYLEKNKDITHWSQWSPITLTVPDFLREELEGAKKAAGEEAFLEISYNGSWRPLCRLYSATKREVVDKPIVLDSEFLNKLFTETGLSKIEFAKRVEVSTSTLNRWLKGESKPSADSQKEILAAFKPAIERLENG